jgi:hypothetical protein
MNRKLLLGLLLAAGVATAMLWKDPPGGGWTRAAVVAAAIAAMVLVRGLRRLSGDVAVLLVLGLVIAALVDMAWDRGEAPAASPPPAVATFRLPVAKIEPPIVPLKAPADIEIIAVEPVTAVGSRISHSTSAFSARLLTSVRRSKSPAPKPKPSPKPKPPKPATPVAPSAKDPPKPGTSVLVTIHRGRGNATVKAFLRALRDGDHFFLLRAGPACATERARHGLSLRGAAAILRRYGFSPIRSRGFAHSFTGPIDFVALRKGQSFRRYFSDGNERGWFLTKKTFHDPQRARKELELPLANQATRVQEVTVTKATMGLRGDVRATPPTRTTAIQIVVLRQTCFKYGNGSAVR